jgi:hypothetical protein
MSLSVPIATALLTATLTAGAPPAAGEAPDQFTITGSVTKTVPLTRWGFVLGGWYLIPPTTCPPEAPYLSHDEFHEGSGWNVPLGVEITYRDVNLGVTIWPATRAEEIDGRTWIRNTGIGALSSITNYKGPGGLQETNWVEVTLHCTN